LRSSEIDLHRILHEWDDAHSAAAQLYSIQVELLQQQVKLGREQRALSKLKEQSSTNFSRIQKKKSGLSGLIPKSSFGKSEEKVQAEKERQEAQAAFEKSHSKERQQAEIVSELQISITSLTSKRDAVGAQADPSDKLWSGMQSAIHGRLPGADELDAEETLQKADAEVEEAQKQLVALTRARLSIQHAHKYFSDALKVCDDLNPGSKLSALSEGLGGDLVNMSKQNDYNSAIRQAEKAQTCLEECIRCLEPYWYTIIGENAADFEALKASGVMQVKRVYDLLYKGGSVDTHVRDAVKIMLERQENVFNQLTRTAVWTQGRVPECEIAEIQAKVRLEEARGLLAAFWKKA